MNGNDGNNIISQERLLIIDPNADKMAAKVASWLKRYEIAILEAKTGFEGLEKYKIFSPGLVLIKCDLDDISGMSVSSIIKDGRDGAETFVILYNFASAYQNTKADLFFAKMDDGNFSEIMQTQLNAFYSEKFAKAMYSMELQAARRRQYQMLPEPIFGDKYNVINLFSAFSAGLSGDGYDYWQDEGGNLIGLLFDCTGHDITAYSQVTSLRSFLKKDMKLYEFGYYKSLPEVLQSVNDDFFAIDISPEMAAAIIFKLDVKQNKFFYCTAGMPGLLVKTHSGLWKQIPSENFLLGCSKGANFDPQELDISDLRKIVCCSDGLYELLFNKEEVEDNKIAKHDDVSAVVIRIN